MIDDDHYGKDAQKNRKKDRDRRLDDVACLAELRLVTVVTLRRLDVHATKR